MELKHGPDTGFFRSGNLPIAPDGIETRQRKEMEIVFRLPIAPDGIETDVVYYRDKLGDSSPNRT